MKQPASRSLSSYLQLESILLLGLPPWLPGANRSERDLASVSTQAPSSAKPASHRPWHEGLGCSDSVGPAKKWWHPYLSVRSHGWSQSLGKSHLSSRKSWSYSRRVALPKSHLKCVGLSPSALLAETSPLGPKGPRNNRYHWWSLGSGHRNWRVGHTSASMNILPCLILEGYQHLLTSSFESSIHKTAYKSLVSILWSYVGSSLYYWVQIFNYRM
jgi:hypothetical protein